MTQRNKNLLEAFKATGAGSPPAPAPVPTPVQSSPPPPSLLQSMPRPHPLAHSTSTPLAVMVLLVSVVLAFLLGRWSVGSVEAANSEDDGAHESESAPVDPRTQPPPQQVQSPPPAAPASTQFDPTPRTAHQEALLDARNVYTIKVVEYSNTETNRKLAQSTLQYLTEQQGLPASIAGTGTRLYILVSAAPKQVDLDDMMRRIKTMSGPPPLSRAGEFGDAYLEKIDKVFKRK